jgi:cytochrome c oxidase assembly factor 6
MDKTHREQCWAARDAYFACLEANPSGCASLLNSFQGSCPPSWFKHFLERRTFLQQQEQLLQRQKEMEAKYAGKRL